MAYYNDEQLAKKLQQELADEELAKKLQDEWNLQPQPNVVVPGIVPPGIIHPPRPVNTVLDRVCGMVYDNEATRLAGKYGLNVQNVSWEDNARSKGSSWGPCISDMTLQVDGHMLPVIRSPNFEDLTWDIPMEKIPLVVGNEKGGNLHTVTLKQYLENFRNYLHKPNGWKGHRSSLFAARDTHVVTSAQACFLPITASEETKFNVAIYNYQTRHDDPAILAIVASSKGTSAQVLTGSDSKLYFNNNGEKCPFVGQRLTDFRREKGEPTQGPMTQQEKQQNMLLIIQVPLKQKLPPPQMNYLAECYDDECEVMPQACLSSFAAPSAPGAKLRSNVEDAIIKVGKSEGSFEEIQNFDIERDERYPVRVTMQFYKATDNGVVNDDNIKQISEQIQGARKNADFIGSLVVGGVSNRPTEPTLPNRNPYVTPAWWTEFWLVYRNVFPQYTEERAKDKVFSGGRFANSTMNEAKDQLIDILSAESDPNKKPQPVWNVL